MKLKHEPSLDGLRALAVLAVVLFHANRALPGGALGVDVFFVLSGYLITSILLSELDRTDAVDVRSFLVRRARRLLPALAVLLVIYVALGPLFWSRFLETRWIDVGLAATYTSNWASAFADRLQPLAHTWSLGIEEQFYLCWPIVILMLTRLKREHAAAILVSLWGAITVARLAWLATGRSPDFAYFATPFHASGLMLGAALAYRPVSLRWGWVGLIVLAVLCGLPHGHQWFRYTIPISEVATVAVVAGRPVALGWAPLAWLGRISYGVYLWHIPVWHALPMYLGPARLPALVGVSVGLAAISHYGIERRFLRSRQLIARDNSSPAHEDDGHGKRSSLGEGVATTTSTRESPVAFH